MAFHYSQASSAPCSQDEKADYELQGLQRRLQGTASPGGLVGTSAAMQAVQRLIAKAVGHHFPVVILGETGTGKELVARSIHYSGSGRDRPFVPVDCSSLTPTLIESELFGYVRGAFTGAAQDKKGLFQAANGGTLFLDEIGELPKELQAKLLRAVQEGEVRRVGSTQGLPVDVRIVAATNRDLKQAAEDGTFREDLYYRLNVFPITLPPLREHPCDIPLLVTTFLNKYADPTRPITSVAKELWAELMTYDWPGNVRELENFVERSIALGSGPELRNEDPSVNLSSATQLWVMERRAILEALRETAGDKIAAARILGIGKTTVYRKLKQYQEFSRGDGTSKAVA
jgi:transcriptional regulator with PAS, ATPase and Fis domain